MHTRQLALQKYNTTINGSTLIIKKYNINNKQEQSII